MSTIENGVYAAVLTPLDAALRCDVQRLFSHCNDVLEKGCRGVVLFGTTGEGPSFSVTEKCAAIQKLIELGMDPNTIIVGNGSSNLQDSVDLGLEVADLGCRGYLLAPPCFFRQVEEAGVLDFYRCVISSTISKKISILLYHIPQYTGIALSKNLVLSLRKEFPAIVVGIKESEGNISLIQQILQEDPHCKVFVGRETLLLEAMQIGASGAICGIANLYPKLLCSVYKQEKNSDAELQKIAKGIKSKPFIPFAKYQLSLQKGKEWQRVRPPLVSFV